MFRKIGHPSLFPRMGAEGARCPLSAAEGTPLLLDDDAPGSDSSSEVGTEPKKRLGALVNRRGALAAALLIVATVTVAVLSSHRTNSHQARHSLSDDPPQSTVTPGAHVASSTAPPPIKTNVFVNESLSMKLHARVKVRMRTGPLNSEAARYSAAVMYQPTSTKLQPLWTMNRTFGRYHDSHSLLTVGVPRFGDLYEVEFALCRLRPDTDYQLFVYISTDGGPGVLSDVVALHTPSTGWPRLDQQALADVRVNRGSSLIVPSWEMLTFAYKVETAEHSDQVFEGIVSVDQEVTDRPESRFLGGAVVSSVLGLCVTDPTNMALMCCTVGLGRVVCKPWGRSILGLLADGVCKSEQCLFIFRVGRAKKQYRTRRDVFVGSLRRA